MKNTMTDRTSRKMSDHEGVSGSNGAGEGRAARLLLGNIELAALDGDLAYRGPERRNDAAASLAQLLACVLDEVDYGLLMLSADGLVVHANQAARHELASTTSLRLVGQRLLSRTAAEQSQLDSALAAARDDGRRTMLSIATQREGEHRVGLSIVPLPVALTHAHAGHAVLISFERSRIAETLSVDAHAREHGLTLREQQVLAALCDGLRAKEIALRLEIGEATVRTHVNNIKAKTGCASIVDIVNKVSRLPPMVAALRRRVDA
ncbi:MAG: LuxR C-terminal-related transcriptional regulator [Burkholderiaceae bacterium]